MNYENVTKEDLLNKEKKLKELYDQKNKLLKEKTSLVASNEYLRNQINLNQKLITNYNVKISQKDKPKEENTQSGTSGGPNTKKSNLIVKSEQIFKDFENIQRYYNANLQEKLKSKIDVLYGMQKDLRVKYILIKKLDIDEKFLQENKINESNNNFENLKNLAKIGKLHYCHLEDCGPVILVRINCDSTFQEIKDKCCDIWSLNGSTYSLYDDAFNNLECCYKTSMTEFFNSFQPYDRQLNQGQVCFYLMEKLKVQRELLESQEKCIDSKSDNYEEGGDKGSSFGGNELEECLKLIKENKILKGIENFKIEKFSMKNAYIKVAQKIDNNILFILITILYIILSIFSISNKRNIYNWNAALAENKMMFGIQKINQLDNLKDYMTFFLNLIDHVEKKDKHSYVYMGPVQFRFFKTLKYDCISDYKNFTLYKLKKIQNNNTDILCSNFDHYDTFRDQSGFANSSIGYNYTFIDEDFSNITHSLNSPLGYFDTSGIIINIFTYNSTDKEIKLKHLNIIKESLDNVQAIEYSFNIYEPTSDVFIANSIFVQLGINQIPIITRADAVQFYNNIYDTNKGPTSTIDLIRWILLVILISTIPLRIYQKFITYQEKNYKVFIRCCFIVIFQMKNILIIFSLLFILMAYNNFSKNYFDPFVYHTSMYFSDLYDFANQQKNSISLDVLSMYLMVVYSLKYLQYFESFYFIFIALKKSAFEYFVLLLTICILFLGLSILTNFVFGSYIYEYKSYYDSIAMNIKIFIFVENTNVTSQFLNYFKIFSIMFMIVFIFIIRYYLLNLFYPIFIEYYRNEIEKYQMSKIANKNQQDQMEVLSFKEKILYLIWPFRNTKKKRINEIEDKIMIN